MIIRRRDTLMFSTVLLFFFILGGYIYFMPKVKAVSIGNRTATVSCPDGVMENCSIDISLLSMNHAELQEASACRNLAGNVSVIYTVVDADTGEDYNPAHEATFVGSNNLNYPLSMAHTIRFLDKGADGNSVPFGKQIPISHCE